LTIDLNDNVVDSQLSSLLASIRLIEAITCRYVELKGLQHIYQKGKVSIDGIFIPN